ncbi:MAG: EAL domain-containing protein [Acetobacteraceae bacterium]|nr:EAL domain-containing protein [Acetobacteraceae bacterium]
MRDGRERLAPPFGIAFQPVVSLVTRRLVAQEALVRGVGGRPAGTVLGRVEPAARPAFELSVVQYAMSRAIALGIAVDLHVNLSPHVLTRSAGGAAEAAERLLRLTEAEGFPPQRLVLEMTEGERIDDPPRLRRLADAARTVGLRLALDDFGAGYNGLALLAEVEPDLLKIDMALTRGIDRDRVRRSILSGVMRMVEGTGIRVIAEGVETMAELAALADLGVEEVQGFLIGAPAFERAIDAVSLPMIRPRAPLPVDPALSPIIFGAIR